MDASKFSTESKKERRELTATASVGRIDLNGYGRNGYIYLFENIGWCGSAGCALLIGERQADGSCQLLFSGSGSHTATVRRPRDHGYHRLYLPCEVRFDGRQYQQLHPECPTVDIQR
jgi:hypothetical protein